MLHDGERLLRVTATMVSSRRHSLLTVIMIFSSKCTSVVIRLIIEGNVGSGELIDTCGSQFLKDENLLKIFSSVYIVGQYNLVLASSA